MGWEGGRGGGRQGRSLRGGGGQRERVLGVEGGREGRRGSAPAAAVQIDRSPPVLAGFSSLPPSLPSPFLPPRPPSLPPLRQGSGSSQHSRDTCTQSHLEAEEISSLLPPFPSPPPLSLPPSPSFLPSLPPSLPSHPLRSDTHRKRRREGGREGGRKGGRTGPRHGGRHGELMPLLLERRSGGRIEGRRREGREGG